MFFSFNNKTINMNACLIFMGLLLAIIFVPYGVGKIFIKFILDDEDSPKFIIWIKGLLISSGLVFVLSLLYVITYNLIT